MNTRSDYAVVLVLSGGNALGSFQGGAYQALTERGIEIDWVVGASAGAINGAIICGNSPESGVARLREFWSAPERSVPEAALSDGPGDTARRTISAQATFAMGQPGIFAPRRPWGPWWEPFVNNEPASLYDTAPLSATLAKLVNFERLNGGGTRFSATAVDLETGEDVVFDTRSGTVEVDHLRASSALVPVFPPVEIEGRLFADAALSANLPLDVVLSDPPPGPTLCLAVDLLPLLGPRPATLGDAAERMQDLIFANQARRAIEGWQRYYEVKTLSESASETAQPAVTLVHLAYANQQPEVSGKMFDYSPESAAYRWAQGYHVMSDALDRVLSGDIEIGRAGLSVHSLQQPT